MRRQPLVLYKNLNVLKVHGSTSGVAPAALTVVMATAISVGFSGSNG